MVYTLAVLTIPFLQGLKGNEMPKTEIKVKLSGTNGNALSLVGTVKRALVRGGHGDLTGEFTREALSGDYGHVLRTCMDYVFVS